MFTMSNDGPELLATDYWDTDHARKGFLYLSANAGVWRLLVPPAAAAMLPEMRTARSAYIERSIASPACWDIVFDDGSDSPFCVSLDRRQLDRAMEPGATQLTVWVPAGKTLTLSLDIRV